MMRRRAVALLQAGLRAQQGACGPAEAAAAAETVQASAGRLQTGRAAAYLQARQLRRQHGGWHSDTRCMALSLHD